MTEEKERQEKLKQEDELQMEFTSDAAAIRGGKRIKRSAEEIFCGNFERVRRRPVPRPWIFVFDFEFFSDNHRNEMFEFLS